MRKMRKVALVLIIVLLLLIPGFTGAAIQARPVTRSGKIISVPNVAVNDEWETLIKVMNVGEGATGAVTFFWGGYTSVCNPDDPGPLQAVCRVIPHNGDWLLAEVIPQEAESAVVYSVAEESFSQACDDAGEVSSHNEWLEWAATYSGSGEDLVTGVYRTGPNDFGNVVASYYTGFSEAVHGDEPPYGYSLPYVMRNYHNLDTVVTIQNSGDFCAGVSVSYSEQKRGRVGFDFIKKVEVLAPGEAIRLERVPEVAPLNWDAPWLGSAYVSSNVPLSIVVDQLSLEESMVDRKTLLTNQAFAYPGGERRYFVGFTSREWSGWQVGIQVMNMTQQNLQTFVTVDFLDSDGGEVVFVGDWVSPNASVTFYLPGITDLGVDYFGGAIIESHDQVAFPGGLVTGQQIAPWVDVKFQYHPELGQRLGPLGGSYKAHAESDIRGVDTFVFPFIVKEDRGITSQIAIRNNSNCNQFIPVLYFHDDTGTRLCTYRGSLVGPSRVKLLDLENVGCLVSGWVGVVRMQVDEVVQLCDIDGDGEVDDEPVMPSLVVLNYGPAGGDSFTVGSGIPIK